MAVYHPLPAEEIVCESSAPSGISLYGGITVHSFMPSVLLCQDVQNYVFIIWVEESPPPAFLFFGTFAQASVTGQRNTLGKSALLKAFESNCEWFVLPPSDIMRLNSNLAIVIPIKHGSEWWFHAMFKYCNKQPYASAIFLRNSVVSSTIMETRLWIPVIG